VLLAADGLRNDEIAARCAIVRPTASKWRGRFFEQRVAGLVDRPRCGRPREDEEDVYKNPSDSTPNDPDDAGEGDWDTGWAIWGGVAGPGYVRMFGQPRNLKSRADASVVAGSADMVIAASQKLPYEPIPEGFTQGGGQLPMQGDQMVPPSTFSDTRDLVARQAMRYKSGAASPDIERIVDAQNGPGSGAPAGPGDRAPGPGGGGMAPGGQGGPTPGGGPGQGIPGLEPVPGGGQASGWPTPNIPGLEPGAGGPCIEPILGGGQASGPAPGQPMLRVGSVGDAVREMQELLVRHGATSRPTAVSGSSPGGPSWSSSGGPASTPTALPAEDLGSARIRLIPKAPSAGGPACLVAEPRSHAARACRRGKGSVWDSGANRSPGVASGGSFVRGRW
jgi:hypothetical protein